MKKNSHFDPFLGKDSAEVSAEASVKMAEASVSAESRFRLIRSFTMCNILVVNTSSSRSETYKKWTKICPHLLTPTI